MPAILDIAGLFTTTKNYDMLTTKKRFDIQIKENNQRISQTFDLDKNIVAINGLVMTSDRDDLMYYRGAQKIEINGVEYFPENYESKLLMFGINTDLNKRYYDLGGIQSGNGVLKIIYQDTDVANIPFTPYRISVYLDYSIEGSV